MKKRKMNKKIRVKSEFAWMMLKKKNYLRDSVSFAKRQNVHIFVWVFASDLSIRSAERKFKFKVFNSMIIIVVN